VLKFSSNVNDVFPKVLKLSSEVSECKPLGIGIFESPTGRGSHSSTLQLNLSAFYDIGGARDGCVARVKGVLEGV
jgi:hypothetical protein